MIQYVYVLYVKPLTLLFEKRELAIRLAVEFLYVKRTDTSRTIW